MQNAQKGFTLIELMIVVAIIGILAAIAIPAYQDYTQRAQVGEAFTIVSAAKTAIAEFRQTTGEYPTSAEITSLGLEVTSGAGQYVDAIAINGGDGVITVTMGTANVGAEVEGQTLTFTPPDATALAAGGAFTWACSSSMEQKYLPRTCSNAGT
ncbi:MAG: pilin [Pseudomonadota bacterium]